MARATRRPLTRSDDGTPRPSRPGSAASTATGSPRCGPGTEVARIRYGTDAQQRILAEWARAPQRDQDGAATWSVSLLQRALRQADDGLPQVQHLYDLAHPARGRPELAEEPPLVSDRGGHASAQAWHGHPRRS